MQCPGCNHANRDGARFCEDCGRRLGRVCGHCRAALRETAKYCDSCGAEAEASGSGRRLPDPASYTPEHLSAKILTSRSALVGERKQVTVLFADVKGSMELAEELDPEEWHGLLDRFFRILTDGVHRYEGTVNQYTGDGIMALFGAPIAHEDHAQRACWAALHLQEELRRYADELRMRQQLSFSVRMGINSGEVVVGAIGDDLRMDYTAQGHTVGLAARMQQIAEPGRSYVTEWTRDLVGDFFRLRDLGRLEVKGVREPLRVFELEAAGGATTRLDVSRSRGFSRFVGRGAEMSSIEAAFERASAGAGNAVALIGEAGVGKSRLCHEFALRCRARGVRVLAAEGLPHGKALPLRPVLQLLRALFGIDEHDDAETARHKIAGTLLLLDEAFKPALPLVFDFLGVSDGTGAPAGLDPESRQHLLLHIVKGLVQARSRDKALVVLLEDLHWFDSGSEAFLPHLVDALPQSHALLLVNFRPAHRADWMQGSHYQQLPLAPLGPEASRELLEDLLGADDGVAALGDTVQAHTGGNPFFIEEVVRSLAEAGHLRGERGAYVLDRPLASLVIPPTVQSVLAARIDRLAEREKSVLQVAAVIGKTFTEPVLRRVAVAARGATFAAELPASLAALAAGDFVREESVYPELQLAFVHPLTQEVAYQSQLAAPRRDAHAHVARALSEVHTADADEQASNLAHHWEQAGEVMEAARWHNRAGDWTATRAPAEALVHWRRVRALLANDLDSQEALVLKLSATIGVLYAATFTGLEDTEAGRLLAEGEELVLRTADRRARVRLLGNFARYQITRGEASKAIASLEEVLRIARELEEPELRMDVEWTLTLARINQGEIAAAVATSDESCSFAERNPDGIDPATLVLAFGVRGLALTWAGRFPEAAAALDRADELGRQSEFPPFLQETWRSFLCEQCGDLDAALTHAQNGFATSQKYGTPFALALGNGALGQGLVAAGRYAEAVSPLEHAVEIVRTTSSGRNLEGLHLARLAEAYAGLGRFDAARQTADQAIAVAQRRYPHLECYARLTRASVRAKSEGAKAAEAIASDLQFVEEFIEESGARMLAPLVAEVRAELCRLLGDEAGSGRYLQEAKRMFTEMGAAGQVERLDS